MISIKPISVLSEHYLQYQNLFDDVFGVQRKFQLDALEWLYANNPLGTVVGFDAFENENLVAHYAAIPIEVMSDGKVERGLLSLNTATRKSHQGRGLFIKLAQATYQKAAADGYSFVIGIANHNSTPGFLNKLGFTLVDSLSAKIYAGSLKYNPNEFQGKDYFYRIWNANTLKWRIENPSNKLWYSSTMNHTSVLGDAFLGVLPVEALIGKVINNQIQNRKLFPKIKLFLGLVPDGHLKKIKSIDVPNFLRPSPLNFIYKDLMGQGRTLKREKIFFTFLDFDAY